MKENVFFSSNTATSNGGAIYAANSSYLSFSTATFSNNSSNQSGGVIYMDKSTATFSGQVWFEENKSTGIVSSGGAIYAGNSSYLSF